MECAHLRLSADPFPMRRPYGVVMVGSSLRGFWDEPRPAHPPTRVWRDRALVAVVLAQRQPRAPNRDRRVDDTPGLRRGCSSHPLSNLANTRRCHPRTNHVPSACSPSPQDRSQVRTRSFACGFRGSLSRTRDNGNQHTSTRHDRLLDVRAGVRDCRFAHLAGATHPQRHELAELADSYASRSPTIR